jgi:acyl-CoA synthetase (AMP-forming)/AMP-acid ligase II
VGEAELIAHCRGRLPGYKVPKAIHFESSLPRTKVGKPDKQALRALYNSLASD